MKCTFCGAKETKDNKVLKGQDAAICRSCAETSIYLMDTLVESDYSNIEEVNKKILSPKDYKDLLDKFVIGQDAAKKVLSVSIYNHLKRVDNPDISLNKNNVLMVGPTGVGKTHLVEVLSKHLDIPLAICNSTSLTAAGYVGEDVSSVLERLWKNAGEDVKKAENGIIFLDEIDKSRTSGGGTNNKDVSGKAVQNELLKIIEGDVVKIYPEGNDKNRKSGSAIEINTKNILFIAGGAFVGLKDKPGIQMNALGSKNIENSISNLRMQELLDAYGIIPEFYGRFPNIVELQALDISTMRTIMTEPENNILSQYKSLFSLSNVNIDFSKDFITTVANEALEVNTGARGLKTIMEDKLNDTMFNIDNYEGSNITIDFKYNKVKIKKAN